MADSRSLLDQEGQSQTHAEGDLDPMCSMRPPSFGSSTKAGALHAAAADSIALDMHDEDEYMHTDYQRAADDDAQEAQGLRQVLQAERAVFDSQFPRFCRDADFDQKPPDSTTVFGHWRALVEDYALVLIDEQTEENLTWRACCGGHQSLVLEHSCDALAQESILSRPTYTTARSQEGEAVSVCREAAPDGIGELEEITEKRECSRRGVLEVIGKTRVRRRVMGVDEALCHFNTRYVAYCLLMADIYRKMLRVDEAVAVCQKALHALVCRQRHLCAPVDAPRLSDVRSEAAIEEQIDYVWRRLLRYVNESRLSRPGKAAVLLRFQKGFATERFVTDSRLWLNAERIRTSAGPGADAPFSPPAVPVAASPVATEPAAAGPGGTPSDGTQAPANSTQAPANSTQAPANSTQAPANSTQAPPPKAEAEAEVGVEGEEEEDLLVQFARTARRYYQKQDRFRGWGYALTVYVLYFAFAFAAVYAWHASHCTASTADDVYLPTGWINGSRVGVPLAADAVRVIKTSLTVGRFGGVYGASWGASAFTFDAADSERLYRERFDINSPVAVNVPRPSCAATCTGQFVCRHVTCLEYNATYSAQSVDIHNARVGAECHCSSPPVWDACNPAGWMLMLVRNYWLWLYYGIAILEVLLFMVATLAVRWPSPPQDSFHDEAFQERRTADIRQHKVALLIAHYGGYGALAETLEPALEVFPPEHIFVCHNANFKHPFDKGKVGDTLEKIRALERRKGCSKHINYGFSCEGNKTLSIYVNAIKKCANFKYVMMIDNDVVLPRDLYIPMETFTDPQSQDVKALAFTIKAMNTCNRAGGVNWVAAMQDIEYKKAGWAKMLQSQMGSALYAHGAIALWEKDVLIAVLKQHNTMFDGEDLQMGVILHSFNQGYTMKTVSHVSVETEVPAHFACCCWNSAQACQQYRLPWLHVPARMAVAPFKCGVWGCGYAEKSLFRQRVCSWDKGAHRAFLWYLKLLLFNWSTNTLALKPYLFYEIWSVVNDWTWPWLMVVFFNSADADQLSSFVQCMVLITLLDVLLMVFMDEYKFVERRDMRVGPVLCLSFTVYKYVLKALRLCALFYNLVHYFPREEEPLVIGDRGALPLFWDACQIFLDKAEADRDAVRLVHKPAQDPSDTGAEEGVQGGLSPVGGPVEGLSADTLELLCEGDTRVPGGDGAVVYAPRHLYRDKARGCWVERSWQTDEQGAGHWVVEATHGDKPGGSGLQQDLERLAVALEWAAEVIASASERGQFIEEDRASVRRALVTRRRPCVRAADQLEEMRRDGQRRGRDPDEAKRIEEMVQWVQERVEKRLLQDQAVAEEAAAPMCEKLHAHAKLCREVAGSLRHAHVDPGNDFASCFFVVFAVAAGVLCGTQWHSMHENASSIGGSLGISEDWVAFLAFISLVLVCGGGALLFPLCISRAQGSREVAAHSPTQWRLGKKKA